MTAASSHTHAHPNAVAASTGTAKPGLVALAATLWTALGQARAEARAIASLNRLDDRALKDIGMHRTEITSIVHHELRDPSRLPR